MRFLDYKFLVCNKSAWKSCTESDCWTEIGAVYVNDTNVFALKVSIVCNFWVKNGFGQYLFRFHLSMTCEMDYPQYDLLRKRDMLNWTKIRRVLTISTLFSIVFFVMDRGSHQLVLLFELRIKYPVDEKASAVWTLEPQIQFFFVSLVILFLYTCHSNQSQICRGLFLKLSLEDQVSLLGTRSLGVGSLVCICVRE